MELIRSSDTNSNTYFFLSNFNDTFKAGKNSFIVNSTRLVVPDTPISVTVYDSKNNILPSGVIRPVDARFSEQTNTGEFYYVSVLAEVDSGVGKIEISGTGVDIGGYTGSIAYFNNQAYPISRNQRLPLVSAPNSDPFPKVQILWSRNILIDTTKKADCEVRFFDTPYIEVTPEIHEAPLFPSASFRLASGSFSSVAVLPKNNANGDYDRQFDVPIYQLFWNGGSKFSSSMESEYIRIKGPSVKNFTYTNQTNNQVTYEGKLNTDFIAQIRRVVNDTTILLDIPFSTVSELIDRNNLDSPYAKNNLVNIKGYNSSDDPTKQSVYHKRNFYVLSIDSGEFEIFYKSIQQQLPRAPTNNSIKYKKSVLNIGYNNLKTLCGAISSYKVYGRSLNSPESKTLLREGRIDPYNLIHTTKFDNGLYSNPGEFFTPNHLSRYWLSSSLNITFAQSHEVLINGANISHTGNNNQTDYVIFKDDTSSGRTAAYVSYNLIPDSHWYAKSDAFINSKVYPTASYLGIENIPTLSTYSNSQENLISGSIHDSNPIKLRANSVYEFSMYVKISSDNTSNSILYAYFLSGNDRIKIAEIDNSIGSNTNEKYTYTFYSDIERYGTIILVPVSGTWSISKLSLVPYHYIDYSVDSFDVKVPLPVSVNNELYEIETELYDEAGRLAYGKDSYTFVYNKTFLPLKKQIFVDPDGLTVPGIVGSGGGGSGLVYFGPNIVMDINTGKITATQFNSSNVPIGSPPPAGTIVFGSYIGLNLTTGAVTAYDFDTN